MNIKITVYNFNIYIKKYYFKKLYILQSTTHHCMSYSCIERTLNFCDSNYNNLCQYYNTASDYHKNNNKMKEIDKLYNNCFTYYYYFPLNYNIVIKWNDYKKRESIYPRYYVDIDIYQDRPYQYNDIYTMTFIKDICCLE